MRRSTLPLITRRTSGDCRQMARQWAQSQTHMPQHRRPVSCAIPWSRHSSSSLSSIGPPSLDLGTMVAMGTDKKILKLRIALLSCAGRRDFSRSCRSRSKRAESSLTLVITGLVLAGQRRPATIAKEDCGGMHTPRPWRRRSPDLFRFPPLVCTSGWPNVAGLTLLRQLAAGGSRLHLHAGWDGPGLGIVQLLVA